MIDGKSHTEGSIYKLIYNSNSYNKFIEYINNYNYRKKWNSFLKQGLFSPYAEVTYTLMIYPVGYVSSEDRLTMNNITYKLIFNKDEDINQFVENIIEIIKGDEVLQ